MVAFISVLLVETKAVAISFKKSVTPNRSLVLDFLFLSLARLQSNQPPKPP